MTSSAEFSAAPPPDDGRGSSGSTRLVVTVFGNDRPGIIADVTGALTSARGNLEDSSMTILHGRLAMMLVVSTPATAGEVADALRPLETDLQIAVREVPPEPAQVSPGSPYLLSVHGGDRPGIVSAVARALADIGGNITDLSTRLAGGLYVLVAEVDLPLQVDVPALQADLTSTAAALGVHVDLRPASSDLL